ncbi:MAG: NAD(P)H-binding protein [Mucilaginibacter sp.]
MHILILGPTGRTGRLVVDEALKRGHKVSVLVSHEYRLKTDPKLLDVHEGTPLNIYTLSESMQGCDAILSTLNISRTSDFPWAALRTGQDFLSLSMNNILEAAAKQQVKRIIIATTWGVGETRKYLPFWFKWLIDHSNMRFTYQDHTKAEEMLKNSDMDFTAIQPVKLTDGNEEKQVKVSINNTPKPSRTISRQNVARFMLDLLENDLYHRECPVISEK